MFTGGVGVRGQYVYCGSGCERVSMFTGRVGVRGSGCLLWEWACINIMLLLFLVNEQRPLGDSPVR